MASNSQSGVSILKFLQNNNAEFDGYGPLLVEKECDEDNLKEWAKLLDESKMEAICSLADVLLLRGSSGEFYLNTGGLFYPLGSSLGEVIQFFNGEKDINQVTPKDPYDARKMFDDPFYSNVILPSQFRK